MKNIYILFGIIDSATRLKLLFATSSTGSTPPAIVPINAYNIDTPIVDTIITNGISLVGFLLLH